MKKKQEHQQHQEDEEKAELEIVKAVAQAWHGRSGSTRPAREFDAHRSHHHGAGPSRFKLEATKKMAKELGPTWDFRESLWDSYEIVTVSKRLEAGLVLDSPLSVPQQSGRRRKRESKNSLRNLFSRISTPSKRFDLEINSDEE